MNYGLLRWQVAWPYLGDVLWQQELCVPTYTLEPGETHTKQSAKHILLHRHNNNPIVILIFQIR